MDADLLIQLEVLIVAVLGTAATVFGWILKRINGRLESIDGKVDKKFDSMGGSVSKLHDRIDDVIKEGHSDYRELSENISKLSERTVRIEAKVINGG